MKFALPHIPLWLVVLLAGAIGAGAIGAEIIFPRGGAGSSLENHAGFHAAAGFVAALVVLAGGRLARLLRDRTPDA
jgi:hypothetical protein